MNEETILDLESTELGTKGQGPKEVKKEPEKREPTKKAPEAKEPEKKEPEKKEPKDMGAKPSIILNIGKPEVAKAAAAVAVGRKLKGSMKAAGLAGAAASIAIPLQIFPSETSEGEELAIQTEGTEAEHVADQLAPQPAAGLEGHDMSIATGVDDSMSFNKAFATARAEVGPGGIFEWHGQAYGTYYKNEWDAMSPEEHDQYWADVHHTVSTIEDAMNSIEDVEDEPLAEVEEVVEEIEEPVEEEELAEVELIDELIEADEDLPEVELIDEVELAEEPIEAVDADLPDVEIFDEPLIEAEVSGEPLEAVDGELPEMEVVEEVAEEVEVPDDIEEIVLDEPEFDPEDVPEVEVPEIEDTGSNPDIDESAIIDLDPNIAIENNLNMSEFV